MLIYTYGKFNRHCKGNESILCLISEAPKVNRYMKYIVDRILVENILRFSVFSRWESAFDNCRISVGALLVAGFILFSSSVAGQDRLLVLEAEHAQITLPSKVKYVTGYSGNAYVGDNDPGSSIVFRNVTVDKEGTYEFRTYYTSMHLRAVAIRSGYYPEVISVCPHETEDWNRPPTEVMYTYIYLDKGNNTLRITPHNGGGPNIDKFELWETTVAMPRPAIQKNSFNYDLTDDAHLKLDNAELSNSVLNDNDEFTVYPLSGTSGVVNIECDMPYLLTGYLFSAGPDGGSQASSWKLESSANGLDYSEVNPTKFENRGSAFFGHIQRIPHAEPSKAAKYYRITTTGTNAGEIQLFGVPYLTSVDGKNFPEDITANTNILTGVLGNPLGTFLSFADERCYNLFDRNMAKKYYWGQGRTFEVEIEPDDSYHLEYYTLTSCQDYPQRDPQSWVVEGFDTDWEVVSEVKDFIFPCRYATMKFGATSTKRYKGFRLRVTENNGADAFQLLKWQLFGDNRSVSAVDRATVGTSLIAGLKGKIMLSTAINTHCVITDISGQLIKKQDIEAGDAFLDVDSGIYLVGLHSPTCRQIQKVIVN